MQNDDDEDEYVDVERLCGRQCGTYMKAIEKMKKLQSKTHVYKYNQ